MQGFNRLKECRHGLMLYNINDVFVGRSLDVYGEFSEFEAELFGQVVHAGDLVVEVGANIGAHTLFLAKAVGVEGAVMAFEPQRIVYQTLCANMALNSIPNAHCLHAAVGEAPGAVVVPEFDYNLENNYGGLSLGEHVQGESVGVVTLDSFTVPSCRFLKIDVEGMELDVLKGATKFIAQHRPVLYIENDREDRSPDLVRFTAALGYRMYWHKPPLFNPNNFLKNPENVFPNIVSENMFCIHSSAGAEVRQMEPVVVP